MDALAARLQDEGAKAFVKSWNDLLAVHRLEERGAAQGGVSGEASRPRRGRFMSVSPV